MFVTTSGFHGKSLLLVIFVTLTLSACGGGGNNSKQPEPFAPEPETPVSNTCVNEVYSISQVSSTAISHSAYTAVKAADGDTAGESRWQSDSGNGDITFDLGEPVLLGSVTIKWYLGDSQEYAFDLAISADGEQWELVAENQQSSGKHSGFELVSFGSASARYIRVTINGTSTTIPAGIVELQAHRCNDATGNFTETFPNELGIDLLDWYLSIPTDEDGNGRSDTISETELADGYTNSEYFYASDDGGIVMRSPSYGFKTSTNTNYVRVELREMLRRGDRDIRTQGVNKNNWVFGSASADNQLQAGGVDGDLHVTLAVNNVTTTGENYQIGRVVIGQIHANDDEPVRLYYRKLPGNQRGSIYFAHESRQTDATGDNIETYVEMLGSRSNNAPEPDDGIALDEVFSYHISVNMNLLTVTLSREGKADVVANYDMSTSLYDADDQYHYFKVGVYHLNNSSDPAEYAQATFYEIRNSHTGYAASE
jgi:poly(beta-D-mannuronate) lyase|tara:strand:- start:5697 stop:7142 length:1446 start_codon:yes stop_codon:yes gene_type:complete